MVWSKQASAFSVCEGVLEFRVTPFQERLVRDNYGLSQRDDCATSLNPYWREMHEWRVCASRSMN